MTRSNQDYWERRQAQDMFGYMEEAEDTADQISRVYLKASRQLSLWSDEIFEKYRKEHGLSEAEARRLVNSLYDKASIEELLRALRNGSTDKNKKELLAELEAPAYQARLERLQQIQNQLDALMQTVYQQEKNFSTSLYTDLATESYYRGIYNIQQQAGVGFPFAHVSAKQVDAVLNSRWSGENYSSRIWKNTGALADTLKEELLVSLITGRTNRETAEIIANKFAQGASNARRLVRTESNFLSCEMNFKAYEASGVEKYQYLATLDLRTSAICRALDGKLYLVKDRKVGTNCPPMHPWCRSTTISVISEKLMEQMERAAIDPATGKTIFVPRMMTYAQWYEKYVKGKPEVELEEKKIKNRSSDRTQHKKYRQVLGKNVPESLDDFQRMKYNKSESWEQLKQEYRDSNRYQRLIEEAGKLNIKGRPIKRIDRTDLDEYAFREDHINAERKHMVTKELAQQYVTESVAAYRRWNGDVTVYISPRGAAVVNHKEKTISTAYRSEEYDEKFIKLLEVLKVDKVSNRK